MTQEKQVSYKSTNSYSTLNTFSEKTKNVWIVFHGLGYLSKYFINYFSDLNSEENYIIAPQAPSKYYQDKKFKHVGASWLTRVETELETKNILEYIDAVVAEEFKSNIPNLIIMGYSQGVSVASRWVAKRKIQCDYLLLHSGAIPVELQPSDFSFQSPDTKVIYHYGVDDPYITEAKKTEQQLKGTALFENRLQVSRFEGKHVVDTKFLLSLSQKV